MKNLKTTEYSKGILLIIAGIIIACFPQFLSGAFTIVGALIIIYNVIIMIYGIFKNLAALSIPKAIAGILFGIFIIILPNAISYGLPLIIGIFALVSGFDKFFRALELKKNRGLWIIQAAIGMMFILCGIGFIFNLSHTSKNMRIIIGILIIIGGIGSLISTYKNSEYYSKNSTSSIVDIDSYSVSDDDNNKRIK